MKFYILEYADQTGLFYIDNQFGYTDNVLMAERYPSPEEALKYKKYPTMWIVRTVTITVT